MFNRASKSELKTWMIGDLVLFIILTISSISVIGTFAEDTEKIGYLIFGLIFLAIAFGCVFLFYKMILAFRSYEERMEEYAKLEAIEKEEREKAEKERLEKEAEETKKFIEEYQRKVAEAEEQRRLEKEQAQAQK